MQKLNIALVRFLQFTVFVLFTFIVLVYFGALLLLPLDVIALAARALTAIGFNGFIAALIGAAASGYFVLLAYKIPGLGALLFDIGLELVNTARFRIEAFNPIVEQLKSSPVALPSQQ